MDTIAIVNRSSVADAVIRNIIPALQDQVTQDFEPVWRIGALIAFIGKGEDVPAGSWPLEIFDHTDVEGAGGYHVDERGRVSGKAFWLDAVEAGEAPTVDVSHEMLEMLADPTAGTDPSYYVDLPGGDQCLPEVCDAVEDDHWAYNRLGADGMTVLVSDFVIPAYFRMGTPPPPQVVTADSTHRYIYDFRGALHAQAPGLLMGGYLGIRKPDGTWTQVQNFAEVGTARHLRSARRVASQVLAK